MGKLIEKIIEIENLHWAWKKVKNSFQVGDIWYDEIELSSFEANLYDNLNKIKEDIKSNTYTLSLIKPLPFPKGCDKKGKPRVRQTFDICIKDQIVWMAVVNAIGDSLDFQMPWWSYGHRLYVPVWKGESEQWEVGWYTHSKGLLYRKWNQSWPLFRRSISLTAKIMCGKKTKESYINDIDKMELDEAENNTYENNELLPNHFKSKYLEKNYWQKSAKVLYWGTIDFSKFYPKVKRSVIEKNILTYVENAKEDKEFKALLAKLMDFKINSDRWTKKELSDIELDPQNFQGLPTGLFVAGFLANVALLDVDKQILNDLETNREIAHFRFVDDHVILSYDFDKLQEWIKTYKKYLEEADTGTEFNFDKIEPQSLAKIISSDKVSKKRMITAKKECALDPAFPAPLMTQTLAKVSAISKSDLEFLTLNEEEQLISDLEHLLLTDFPDHELRKDTRVSFAASMLSKIIPNTKDDYSKVYECQKRIHYELKNYHKKFDKLNEKFVSDKLHDLIFSENIDAKDYFAKWDNEIKEAGIINDKEKATEIINNIKKEKEYEIKLEENIKKHRKERKLRVYKLLKKAISENPEKVRIWTRVIDYCKKSGECDIKEAYILIKQNKNIHELSASYLQTLFMNVIADRLMRVIFNVVNDHIVSQKEKIAAKHFIETIFNEDFLDDIFSKEKFKDKVYCRKTCDFFRFVLGSVIFALENTFLSIDKARNLIKRYKLIDWSSNPRRWIENTQLKDINSWLYWLLWKTHDKSSSNPLNFWKQLQPYIDFLTPTCKALILPFPDFNDIPQNNDNFLEFILNKNFDEGWIYEIFKTEKEKISQDIKVKLKEKYIKLYNNIFSKEMSLWDFIQWQQKELLQNRKNEIEAFNKYFDPRLSEWTALMLLLQIIEKTETTADSFFSSKLDTKLHLANFYLSEKLLENENSSWIDWKRKMQENEIIISTSQISDERYTTKGLLKSEQHTGEQAKVHAFGIMLLQLVTHRTDFPWIWNSTDKSLTYENVFYKKIQYTPLSSYTMLILQACFSSKNRESFKLKSYFKGMKIDATKDIPPVNDVYTLKKYINKAKGFLEKYHLSMENNMARQLLPISLEPFSIKNNPFDDTKKLVKNIENDFLRIGLILTSLDQSLAWDSSSNTNSNLSSNVPITMSHREELRIWNEIKKGFSYLKAEPENNRPHIVILPELTIPLSREIELQRIASKIGAVIIAGLDFNYYNGQIENKAVVIVPKSWPQTPSYGSVNKFYFGKTFFSYEEKDYFKNKGKAGKPWSAMYILDAGDYGKIGVAICSDFFDIERFLIYKGAIQHMFVIAYNKDIKSYYFLAEAISRLVYCNVVICNTGYYGGSLIFSPYSEEYKRYIYKHEGGKLFTTQILNLPVKSLYEAQSSTSEIDPNKVFKAKPPGFYLKNE